MAQAQIEIADHKQFEPLVGIDEDLKYEVPPLNIDPNNMGDENRKRRFSVSAESSDDKKADKFVKKVYPKSKEALNRIKQSTVDVFLFSGLDNEQRNLLIDAMFEKKIEKGDEIINQNDRGDYFYVIESGIYEVWKSSNAKLHTNPKKVFTYNSKGSFGELALMYNSPRAATVKAVTNGVLWAVDRITFRHIIVGCTARKRKKYDNFLKDVHLLLNCSDELRASIADILESVKFNKNEYILREGDVSDNFYFIQKGEASVTITQKNGKQKIIRTLRHGDYFGERGLLMNDVRSANVIVKSGNIEIAGMDNASFMRLLGPLYDKFRQNQKYYVFKEIVHDDNALSDIE